MVIFYIQKGGERMQYTRDNINEFEYRRCTFNGNEELHYHSRIEIIRIRKGNIRLRTDMGSLIYDVYEDDYAVIKSPDVHRIFSLHTNNEIEQLLIPISYQNMFEGDYIKDSFVIPKEVFENNPDLKTFAESSFALLSSSGNESPLTRSLCASLSSLMLSLYGYRRTVVSNNRDSAEQVTLRGGVSIETMEKFDTVISHIEKNFTDSKMNLPSLSEFSGLGKTFLSALFPKLTGRSFTSYIHHLRINRSIELITSTEKNISEIAYLCGFETIRSFNNVFKGVVGVTPSSFRLGISGKETKGLDSSVCTAKNGIFSYGWTSNVTLEKDREEGLLRLVCTDTKLKLWCHLRLRFLFFKNRKYTVSFSARLLKNVVGEEPSESGILCNFQFPDSIGKSEFHNARLLLAEAEDDGFIRYRFEYTMPDYYIPSPEDMFSIYSTPSSDLGVGFEVKDIEVKCI